MPLTLEVDGSAWREALRAYAGVHPGIVPVIKGNGYGFGRDLLAAEADAIGVDMVAVSDPEEVAEVRAEFGGDILVMAPWRAHQDESVNVADGRTIRTVGHLEAVRALAGRDDPLVIECVTSMHRHGMTAAELAEAAPLLRDMRVAGFALHLPLTPAQHDGHVPEVDEWVKRIGSHGVDVSTMFVSHVSGAELEELSRRHPGIRFRPRIGTDLWLGTRGLHRARATVLDVRPLRPGQRFGYRQHRVRRASILLVISGGTAHGLGLDSPVLPRGLIRRGKVAAYGALGATGHYLSPFIIGGRKRWFAEPPHMQVSLVVLPAGEQPPEIGDEVPVDVRMTTTRFDGVRGLALIPRQRLSRQPVPAQPVPRQGIPQQAGSQAGSHRQGSHPSVPRQAAVGDAPRLAAPATDH